MRTTQTIITLSVLTCMYLLLLFPSTTQAQDYATAFTHSHERMKRCKRHNYNIDPLNSNYYFVRLNAVNNRLVLPKAGYIIEDTALDGDRGLAIKLDFSNDSSLLPLRGLVYFPEIRDKDTLRRREQNKFLETAWNVSRYIFNDILHSESDYRYIAFYIVSRFKKKVFFIMVTQIDDEIEVRNFHWIKQLPKS